MPLKCYAKWKSPHRKCYSPVNIHASMSTLCNTPCPTFDLEISI
ncbi:Ubiquitin-like domain-containing protein [Psidium guajava]|nr:Ubiquitin-like domain-containing protein [Psidium guajava]